MLFPPNDPNGLRISVKPNGFSNIAKNDDYLTANYKFQLYGVQRFVAEHYPQRIRGRVVVEENDANNFRDFARERTPEQLFHRAIFTNHYQLEMERRQREGAEVVRRDDEHNQNDDNPNDDNNPNDINMNNLNASFSSQSINASPPPAVPQKSTTMVDATCQTIIEASIQQQNTNELGTQEQAPQPLNPKQQAPPQDPPQAQIQQPQSLIERFLNYAPESLRNFRIPRIRFD